MSMYPIVKKSPSKRHKRLSRREKRPTQQLDYSDIDQLYMLEGLERIQISPLAQKFVGCRVGENITTDNPWIFIEKEKIEDHVEFYEEGSDFYPIWAEIKNIPEKEILIGTHNYIQDDKIDFFICVTKTAETLILAAEEKKKIKLREKILNSFNPKPRRWKSLGSEPQVDSELSKNTRPLLLIELEGFMPLKKQKIRFSIQTVENIRDGYIELITTRELFKPIMRKRLDIGIQSSPLKKHTGIQYMNATYCNKNIQYSMEYNDCELSDKVLINLHKFVSEKLRQLGDVLKLNFSLDLYQDDYTSLRRAYPMGTIVPSTEIKSYQDVINCRRRKISCFTWNAIMSGVIAAGHAAAPFFGIEKKRSILNIEFDTVFHDHFILIWYYNDNVYPKFYLHASRDVTAVSFCPYDANILVAGYENGQIAVWDLTGKLGCQKSKEFLTDVQQQNHILINKDTGWMKPPMGDLHLLPVLCSTLGVGHKSTVTAIEWIPPGKYISPQKDYKNSEENKPHMQFVTASIDGQRILVWDLYIPQEDNEVKFRKKFNRLSERPDALMKNISPLVALKKKFEPVCQMVIKHLNFPVTCLFVQNSVYSYEARNPETLNDIDRTTYFNFTEKQNAFHNTQKMLFTTGVGTFHEATWEASDFDPKYYAVNEECEIERFADIHDGPIFICEPNPFLNNVMITIGGSVIAIWYVARKKFPVFWRKSWVRYVTGMWSVNHPLSFSVVRSDGYYEIWNIMERTNSPIQILKYKSHQLTKLYSDTSRWHARKRTCVITDTAGAIKLCTVPSEHMDIETDKLESLLFLEHLIEVKDNINRVKQNYCKKQSAPPEVVEQEEVKVTVAAPAETKKVVPMTTEMKWEQRLEDNKKQILFEKKKINLKEIAKNRSILEKVVAESNEKNNKVKEMVSKQEAIFNKAKRHLLNNKAQEPRRCTFRYDVEAIKETFMSDYLKIEEEMLDVIRLTNYYTPFNWSLVLKQHKSLYT